MAVTGLLLAAATGVLLFSVRPLDYAQVPVLWAKLGLIALGAAAALAFRLRVGRDPGRAGRRLRIAAALTSMAAWLGALACGRLIAFTGP
jgi:formate-dependent nitrite reductase membrane component NrfD